MTPTPALSLSGLPIDDVLDQVVAGLAQNNRLVLAAPPGAGKTTRAPLALLAADEADTGRIIMLEPRRIAARAAASRMASTLGEKVGETIGLRARMDVRLSNRTRIEVVTEGVFTRMILDDPELSGISTVLFDEFHERSLDADLGLALALESQDALREDLKILVMSATLDTERLTRFLNCEVVVSDGRAHPVETRYLGINSRARIEDEAVRAISQALREETGSVLVFLPGMAEINRTAERLDSLGPDVDVTPLFGGLTPAEQDAAIQPAATGRRKVVLATDIAESALTIEGVRVVIDCGLARVPRYDPQLGASRLETIRVARANADQRRGRAGRTQPGVCYRLWDEAQTRGLAPFPDPEILNADLTGLVLDLARWGATDPLSLGWLDAPPPGVWTASKAHLQYLGALDDQGRITAQGKRMGDMPLSPRLAGMILSAAEQGGALIASMIAAIQSERGLGGRSVDLRDRLARLSGDRSGRAKAMLDLAQRWAQQAGGDNSANREDAGAIVASGFPDRIARARPGKPGEYLMANGRACHISADDPLSANEWLAIADLTGGGPVLRIQLAAPLDEHDALQLGGVRTSQIATFDTRLKRLTARRVTSVGAITLSQTPIAKPTGDTAISGLLSAFREHGLSILPGADALEDLIRRVAFLHDMFGSPWPDDMETVMIERAADWLAPLLTGATSFDGLGSARLTSAARGLLDWSLAADLDRLAPDQWTTPTDRKANITYDPDKGPTVQGKVQEFFGLNVHPTIADGRQPLALELLSPAQRPVALTRDICGFWTGGYGDMRKDMRGRYPKHDWPEDPATAKPQRGVKRRS